MAPVRRAVIDVGTNSVKLLVADVTGRQVQPVSEQSRQTRLGQGFYETHRLQPGAITATAQAAADFATAAREARAVSLRIIATSAAREAVNRDELTAAIEQAAGLGVEVISGEQEADWGFQGVTSDPQFAQAPLLLLDVGGGSAQFTLGQAGQKLLRHSFPLGSVRLLERTRCSDPPTPAERGACRRWLKDFLHAEVGPKLAPQLRERGWETGGDAAGGRDARPALSRSADGVQLVGVGGTATILACMEAGLQSFDRARIEATRLSAARVAWHLERLWSLALDQRQQIVGLPANRADVILFGGAIYQAVMEELGFHELRVSTRGLRFAAVMDSAPA